MHRYVIIGSGAAGFSAAESIRALDPTEQITLISDDPHGYYSRPGLAYYLTGEIPDGQLFPKREAHYQKIGITWVRSAAQTLDPVRHRLILKDGQEIAYDRLLIATGSSAIRLPIPGADLEGVLKLDNLEDARKLVRFARGGKSAVVIGGGITSLEIVEGLSSRGMKVSYLMREDRYWRSVLDETESSIVEKRLEDERVRLYHNTETVEILGRKGKVSAVLTKDGKQIPCSLVAAAIGVRPRLDLAKSGGLDVDRGILVDEYLQTSAADVFSAGDAAQVYDPVLGKSVLDSLWKPARDQGACAGRNMAGVRSVYRKSLAFNVTRLANLTTLIIGSVGGGSDRGGEDRDLVGIARGDSEVYRQMPDSIAVQSSFDINHLRLAVGQNTLLGAVLMGDQTVSRPLQELIGQQADITPIREKLLQPNASLGALIADYWIEWKRGEKDHAQR